MLEMPDNDLSQKKTPINKKAHSSILLPLKVQNFRLLFAGQTISTLGDAFYAVALPWFVLTRGGNPQELGVILMAYGLSRIATVLPGGMLSDRLRPRRIMLLADIVRAALIGLLAALALWGQPQFWQLLAIAIPLGACDGLFIPASFSILPDILQDDDLQAGNSLSTSSTQLSNLIGSGLAGAVVGTLSSGVALAIDAITFVASAVSLASLRMGKIETLAKHGSATSSAEERTETGQKGEDEQNLTFWQLVRSSPFIQVAFVVVVIANLTFGGLIEVALPELAHGSLAAGAGGFGLMLSAFGVGALLGSLLIGSLGKLPHRALIGLLASLGQALAIALIPFAGGLIGAMVCMLVMGMTNSVTNILFLTLMQQVIPRHLLGRIMSIIMLASFGSYPLSVVITGIIVTHTGPVPFFPLTGLILAAAIIFGLSRRELREL